MDLLDIFLGPSSRPVRRDARIRVTRDINGNHAVEPDDAESFTLGPTGSIDRVHVKHDRFYHCGCSREFPVGGQCREHRCGRISCTSCFSRCDRCQKPLCLEHTVFYDFPDLDGHRWCSRCHDEIRRVLLMRGVVRGLARPFNGKQRRP
jgi:hypothetical protein